MKKLILSLLFVGFCFFVHAYDFIVDGLYYNINSDGNTVTLTYQNWNPAYTNLSGTLNIPSSVTFNGNSYIVNSIGFRAFSNTGGLTSVIIPNTVTSIDDYAFWECYDLISVTIPNSVKSIGLKCFSWCSKLTSLNIPNSVTFIGDAAFFECPSLSAITVESGNIKYDSRDDCNAIIETESNKLLIGCKNTIIPNSVTSIGNTAFNGCANLTSMIIPNSVISIGDDSFYRCTSLTTLNIPNSVTTIGNMAFGECSGLLSITIPNSVTSIGSGAFYGCTSLISFDIPNSVTEIGESTFMDCVSLTDLRIPQSISSIGNYAFYNCTNLNSFTCEIMDPSTIALGEDVFEGVYDCVLYVPNVSISLYQNTDPWWNFIIRPIPNVTYVSFLSLNMSQLDMISNQTETLIPTILPTDASNKNLIWASSNTDVAIVDQSGNVTSKSLGTTTITATTTDGTNLSASCEVNVYDIATSINLNQSLLTMDVGEIHTLNVTISPENSLAHHCPLLWNSSNTDVAIVDDDGNVTAKSVGSTTITVATTDGTNLSDTCNITVVQPVTSICFNQSSLIILKNSTISLAVNILPDNASNQTLLWSSSNTNIATVDQNGMITAKKVGTAIIIATTTDGTNLSDTCYISVVQPVTSISLSPSSATIFKDGTITLVANVLPTNAYNKVLSWSSSNTNVATVDQNGMVTAKDVGTATITATTTDGSNLSASCDVSVIIPVSSIYLSQSSATLTMTCSMNLTATILPSNATNQSLTWKSNNTSIATVNQSGVVVAKSVGTAIITATTTDGTNLSASCVITVIPAYDIYPTTTELSHIRGDAVSTVVIPFWLSNLNAVSGLQFDITLPTGVSFAIVDDYPDVWLDPTRKARNHSVDVNLISGSKYRVLVSSPTNSTFKGNEGVVMYMRLNIDKTHPIGSYYINTSNVIFVEPNETQHSGYNKTILIKYKYLLGDADCDATVDVADYTVTALYILSRPVETFYSDAANVNGDNQITVTDLVGITNISLGIRPHEYRPAPAISMNDEVVESAPILNASVEADNIVTLNLDNAMPLAGLQLDLQLPQGITLAGATVEGRAVNYQIGTNVLADGNVRLLISSFGDKDIVAGNDAIIKLVLEGTNVNNDMLYITGAQAASRDLKSYGIDDVSLPIGTTSINNVGYSYDRLNIYGKGNTIIVDSPESMIIQVVYINGMVMPIEIKPGHNTIDVGDHGVYIIRVGSSVYKVRI